MRAARRNSHGSPLESRAARTSSRASRQSASGRPITAKPGSRWRRAPRRGLDDLGHQAEWKMGWTQSRAGSRQDGCLTAERPRAIALGDFVCSHRVGGVCHTSPSTGYFRQPMRTGRCVSFGRVVTGAIATRMAPRRLWGRKPSSQRRVIAQSVRNDIREVGPRGRAPIYRGCENASGYTYGHSSR